jgi:drug/metabolite transporter (DMT)-like permease
MLPFPFAGELAGLGTALFFACGATFFTFSSRLVGSQVINRGRLLAATLMLLVAHTLIYGGAVPRMATSDRWFWLGLSGVIGLTLGDAALFQAFVQVGTRLTVLVFSTAPVIAAVLGFLFLDEHLTSIQLLGMAVSLGGVLWVVSEQQGEPLTGAARRNYLSGLFFAFLGALGQALGAITAKFGLEGNFPALSAQIIRMLAATLAIWLIALFQKQVRSSLDELRSKPRATGYMLLGAIFGPVIGVFLSLVAIQYTEVGVASTLIAMVPIFLLPIGYFVFREKVSPRGIFGTLLALAGVAILFLA